MVALTGFLSLKSAAAGSATSRAAAARTRAKDIRSPPAIGCGLLALLAALGLRGLLRVLRLLRLLRFPGGLDLLRLADLPHRLAGLRKLQDCVLEKLEQAEHRGGLRGIERFRAHQQLFVVFGVVHLRKVFPGRLVKHEFDAELGHAVMMA